MAFRILNQGDVAAGFASGQLYDQAEIDTVDLDAIVAGIGGDGVLAGCQVVAQTPAGMAVDVADGAISVAGARAAVLPASPTVEAADANPRFDLVVASSGGTSVVKGTPVASIAGGPVFPPIPAGAVLLASLFVPASTDAITGDHIVDKRVMVPDLAAVPLNTQTGSYTLLLADAGRTVEVDSATAAVVTVPPNATAPFPVGAVIEVCRLGAGAVTIAAGAGVTVLSADAALGIASQYASVVLRKRAVNTWVLTGALA